MGVRLKNWNKAGRLLEGFAADLPNQVEMIMMQNAEIYKNAILQLIEKGDPSWVPKSEEWKQRSGSETLFIGETGTFYENIESRSMRRVKAGKGQIRIFVGARYDIMHSPSGLTMERLAEILQNLPNEGDRPLFGPAYERVRPVLERNFNKIHVRPK